MSNQKGAMSRGCMVALVAVGIVVMLVIASMVVCYIYKDDILKLGLTKLADTVVVEIKADLPEGISAEDLDKALDNFKNAFDEKKIDGEEVQSLSLLFQEIMKDKKVDGDEAKKFLKEIKEVVK